MREDKYLSINGKAQFLSIRSSGSGLPLLLYLHGGPGDAALPLVNSITTSKQLYWFEKSCHFPQWSETEKFNEIMFSLV